MSIYLRYKKMRAGLGFVASLLMVITFFIGIAIIPEGDAEQRTGFLYNFALIVAICWTWLSGIAKLLMMENVAGYKYLNVAALCIFVIWFVVGSQVPTQERTMTTLVHFQTLLGTAWLMSWVFLDVCEIFYLTRPDAS